MTKGEERAHIRHLQNGGTKHHGHLPQGSLANGAMVTTTTDNTGLRGEGPPSVYHNPGKEPQLPAPGQGQGHGSSGSGAGQHT